MPKAHHSASLAKKGKKEPIDYMVYFFMVATPLFELPQAYQIYSSMSAKDVSIFTWLFFCLADVAWLVYAFKINAFPLKVVYSMYLAVETSIVIGIVMYS